MQEKYISEVLEASQNHEHKQLKKSENLKKQSRILSYQTKALPKKKVDTHKEAKETYPKLLFPKRLRVILFEFLRNFQAESEE